MDAVLTRHPDIVPVDSKVLRGNRLGDPTRHETWVYTPPNYRGEPLVGLFALAGFTGHGPMLFNQDPLGSSLSAKFDRLIADGHCPPFLVAAPHCFTQVGGNQYIDSNLVSEVLPSIEARYPVVRWGVFGKSSGGYGPMVRSMLHPETFQAAANHSGDANFEPCYLPDALETPDHVRAAGGPKAWLTSYWSRACSLGREAASLLDRFHGIDEGQVLAIEQRLGGETEGL